MGAAKKYLSTGQVARRFGVKARTVRSWCEQGHFPGSFQVGGRGPWFVDPDAVETFTERMAEASRPKRKKTRRDTPSNDVE